MKSERRRPEVRGEGISRRRKPAQNISGNNHKRAFPHAKDGQDAALQADGVHGGRDHLSPPLPGTFDTLLKANVWLCSNDTALHAWGRPGDLREGGLQCGSQEQAVLPNGAIKIENYFFW